MSAGIGCPATMPGLSSRPRHVVKSMTTWVSPRRRRVPPRRRFTAVDRTAAGSGTMVSSWTAVGSGTAASGAPSGAVSGSDLSTIARCAAARAGPISWGTASAQGSQSPWWARNRSAVVSMTSMISRASSTLWVAVTCASPSGKDRNVTPRLWARAVRAFAACARESTFANARVIDPPTPVEAIRRRRPAMRSIASTVTSSLIPSVRLRIGHTWRWEISPASSRSRTTRHGPASRRADSMSPPAASSEHPRAILTSSRRCRSRSWTSERGPT